MPTWLLTCSGALSSRAGVFSGLAWAEQIAAEVLRASRRPSSLAQTGGSPRGEAGLVGKMVSGEKIRTGAPYLEVLISPVSKCLFPVEGSGIEMMVCGNAVDLMVSDNYCVACLLIVGYAPRSRLAQSVLRLTKSETIKCEPGTHNDNTVIDLTGRVIG